jgi:hypothetical protein
MKAKKYAVFPNYITDPTGVLEYVNDKQLIELYNVDPAECVTVHERSARAFRRIDLDSLIQLHPREDGDYGIP